MISQSLISRVPRSILLVIALFAPFVVVAEELDKQVEVTQAFVPQIKQATKPTLYPDMDDDAYIKPDIDYSITPRSIHMPLERESYAPAQIDFSSFRNNSDYYAKLGIGYPLRSVADIYASRNNSTRGYWVGFLNYDGDYATILNDYDELNSSRSQHLTSGLAAGLYMGRRVLEGRFSYDNDLWSRYATKVLNDEHPLYQSVGADLSFGDSFSDLTRWNFNLAADARQMWSRAEQQSTTLGAAALFGHNLFGGEFRFGASIASIIGSDDYSDITIGGEAKYRADGQKMRFAFGLDYYCDVVNSTTRSYFIPVLELDYALSTNKAIAYLHLGGELQHNDFATLSAVNPYIKSGEVGERSGVAHTLDLGLKGALADSRFSYLISAGYSLAWGSRYWLFCEEAIAGGYTDNNYNVELGELESAKVELRFGYRPNSRLSFDFDGSYNHYWEDSGLGLESGLPTTKLALRGEYIASKVKIYLGCEFKSTRQVSQYSYDLLGVESYSVVEIPEAFDLSFGAEYSLRESISIFANMTNLLNSELYQWARYREYGVGAMVGVKIEF